MFNFFRKKRERNPFEELIRALDRESSFKDLKNYLEQADELIQEIPVDYTRCIVGQADQTQEISLHPIEYFLLKHCYIEYTSGKNQGETLKKLELLRQYYPTFSKARMVEKGAFSAARGSKSSRTAATQRTTKAPSISWSIQPQKLRLTHRDSIDRSVFAVLLPYAKAYSKALDRPVQSKPVRSVTAPVPVVSEEKRQEPGLFERMSNWFKQLFLGPKEEAQPQASATQEAVEMELVRPSDEIDLQSVGNSSPQMSYPFGGKVTHFQPRQDARSAASGLTRRHTLGRQ